MACSKAGFHAGVRRHPGWPFDLPSRLRDAMVRDVLKQALCRKREKAGANTVSPVSMFAARRGQMRKKDLIRLGEVALGCEAVSAPVLRQRPLPTAACPA